MPAASRPPRPAPTPEPPARGARRTWTTLDLIQWTQDYFRRKEVPSPRLEAEMLLAEALGCERLRLYLDFEKPVAEEALARYRGWVKRRAEQREPLAYIVGHAEFLDLRLRVTPAVLIPRPETEELAEWAVAAARGMTGETLRVLDLGTGSGCLALALAAKEPRARVVATDVSPEALEVARANAQGLGLSERVTFLQGDLWGALPAEARGSFDLIVSNPPYVDPALRPTLAPEVREHEPAGALYAEERGLSVIRRIAAEAGQWLKPGGRLGLEISPELASAVRELLEAAGGFRGIEVRRDVRNCERHAVAVRTE